MSHEYDSSRTLPFHVNISKNPKIIRMTNILWRHKPQLLYESLIWRQMLHIEKTLDTRHKFLTFDPAIHMHIKFLLAWHRVTWWYKSDFHWQSSRTLAPPSGQTIFSNENRLGRNYHAIYKFRKLTFSKIFHDFSKISKIIIFHFCLPRVFKLEKD